MGAIHIESSSASPACDPQASSAPMAAARRAKREMDQEVPGPGEPLHHSFPPPLPTNKQQLDPQTEYDQIIRTVVFFGPSAFAAALSYTAIFAILTQPPAGAAAIHHGAKVVRRGHQRFYETQLQEFDWAWHGSGAPETAARIEQVNRIHAGIWKRVPGAYSAPFEGQMAIIGAAYFETLVRRSVGARNEVDPKVKAAWAEWCERVVAHFRTEPSDGGRSYGVNFPRGWDECEAFFWWFDGMAFEEQSTPELLQKGHETAEAFIAQFCELWFPRCAA